MSAEPVPITPARNIALDTSSMSSASSDSLWSRISNWASENKAVVYTIAGVAVVVTGAGVVYYLQDSSSQPKPTGEKRKSKKERRKEKKEAEEAKTKAQQKPAPEPGKAFDETYHIKLNS